MRKLVPEIVLRNYKKNNLNIKFKAFCLHLDISGFTHMTEQLMKKGKMGAETLSNHLNSIFEKSIDIIYENKGFISIFEGDSFTAIFEEKNCGIFNVFDAADRIKKLFDSNRKLETKFGTYKLNFTMGISYGEIELQILKSRNQNIFYFKGPSINNCVMAEKLATKNNIVFTENILQKSTNSIEINYKKIKDYYYLVKNIKIIMNSRTRNTRNDNKHLNTLMKDFYPDNILKKKLEGEFRNVSSVFITLSNSTDLNNNIKKIINLGNKYGGYFNNISFINDKAYLLIYFGTPIMKENLIKRTAEFMKAALEITKVKIGASYGKVFTGFRGSEKRADFTCLGNEINLASRLMKEANWNDIIINRNLYTSLKKTHETEMMGTKRLKGFDKAIGIYRLKEEIRNISPYMFKYDFIGRKNEIKKLNTFLKSVKNNKFGGIIYVEGTAGIGKSRLINEVKKDNQERLHWFNLCCNEIIRKSFNPFISFLANYFEQSDKSNKKENKKNFNKRINSLLQRVNNKKLANEIKRTSSFLAALLNIHKKDSLYSNSRPESRYRNILFALENLIKIESLKKPVILQIEDAQWMDQDSQKAVKHILKNTKEYSVGIICESRFNQDGSLFKFDLENIPEDELILKQFNKSNTSEIVKNIFDESINDNIIELIWEKSEGNPFYAEQISYYIKENNLLENKSSNEIGNIEIPDKINTIIISRLDKLTEKLKNIVQTASVLGREFIIDVLSEMLKDIDINKNVRKIQNRNIWQPLTEIKYIFKHALIRETAYQMQLENRLKNLHNIAAKTIEKIFSNNIETYYGDLAYHHEKAENYDKAKYYLEQAANLAKNNYQNEKALEYYDRLLKKKYFKLNSKKQIEIYIKKIEIFKSIGNLEPYDKLISKPIEIAKKINDNNNLMKLYAYKGIAFGIKGNYDKYFEYVNKQLDLAIENNNKKQIAKAYNNIALAANFQRELDKSIKYHKKAIKIMQENDFEDELYNIYFSHALTHFRMQNNKKFKYYIDKHKYFAKKDNNKWELIKTYSNLGIYYHSINNYKKSIRYFNKCKNLSEKLGSLEYIMISQNNLSEIYIELGKYDKA
ncbi:MAG: AAA family ATPase, partial [Candidatus Mcinerneyibacterium aminivorans]